MVSSRIALHDDLLKNTFRRFDVDGTGEITIANLKEVLGEGMDGQTAEKMLAEADVSHDGKIDYAEFIDYLRGDAAHDKHSDAAAKLIDSAVGLDHNAEKKKARMNAKDVSAKAAADPASPKAAGDPATAADGAAKAQTEATTTEQVTVSDDKAKAKCGCSLQ